MKKIQLLCYYLCIIFLYFLSSHGTLFAQDFSWAKNMGGSSDDIGYSIKLDASGNTYITGSFQGTADFDPSAATSNLTSNGGTDIYIVKLDASGNFLWAKGMGGTSNDYGYSLILDGSSNVYVTGYFQGTVDFDPSAATSNLTSAGSNDIFVLKLDASGNFVWAKNMGGTGSDVGNSLTVDGSSNVYVTGFFQGTADFDPSAGISNLTSAGFSDIFAVKLDASGNFVWAKGMGGTSPEEGRSLALDGSSNVYITGSFQGTADFDPSAATSNLTAVGINDIFAVKLDASGNFVWAKAMGGADFEIGNSIVVDGSSNIYITGQFQFTADFDPGPAIFNLEAWGGTDVYVVKLNSSGNFVWAKGTGGSSDETGRSLVMDGSSNLYVTGSFFGTADFDPSAATSNLTSNGGFDIYALKLDASGNFLWAKNMGGTSNDFSQALALDGSSNVYVTGQFQGTADFDPSASTFSLISAGGSDIFAVKLLGCPAITINPNTLPNATIGTSYNQTLSQTGLSGSPTWSVTTGSLPTGLTLNSSSGIISGTPTTTGTFNFTVQVSGGGCNQTKNYSIVVSCPTITFVNTTANNGTVGSTYSLNASVTGNTSTITYSINPALPTGLSLNTSTGQISGTPTLTTVSTTYTVTASQSSGVCTATQSYTFAIVCPTITINPTSLPNAGQSQSYNQTLSQTGLSGSLTWSVSIGSLPTGLTLNSSSGVISGTPTTTGTFNFTVQVSDGGCNQTKSYTIVVAASAMIQIITADLDFGDILVSQSAKKTVTIKNIGTATLSLTSMNLSNAVFSAGSVSAISILPNESKDIEITFTPSAVTSYSGVGTISSNAVTGTNTFNIKGNGINPTALNTNKDVKLKSYPNPTADKITISVENAWAGEYKVSVKDVLGKEVINQKSNISSFQVDLTNVPSGLYLIQVSHKNGIKTIQVIKK